jgi:type I restriction enzyme S subunit
VASALTPVVRKFLPGSFPNQWEELTLGDVCKRGGGDIQTGPFGSQLHAADYVPVGIPSIMPQNIGDNRVIENGIARITPEDAKRLSRYLVHAGDIVYSRRGDVEKRSLIRDHEDGWLCGTGCLRVRFGEGGVHPPYAAYYLGHPGVREWIVRHAHGATMPNLNTSILSACPFVVPPENEQRAIARILGALDDKIELNRRMNQTLEAMARALFKSWFVDFDGVPPEDMQESELGLIPKGWRVASLSEVLEIIGGGTPKTSVAEYWDGDIPWFSVVDTPAASDVFVTATEKNITQAGLDESSVRLIPEGTTIISARGTVGNLAIAGRDMTFNQSCYGLRGKNGAGDYFVFLTAQHMVNQLKSMAHGSVFSTITRQTFDAIRVAVPPGKLFQQFEQSVSVWFEKILSNVQQSRTLAELRDALLPKLISGEIRAVSRGDGVPPSFSADVASCDGETPSPPGTPSLPEETLASRGWYIGGYLPHYDDSSLVQSITFRLADALPQDKLRQLEEELKAVPEHQLDQQRRIRIEQWLDAGLGSCVLRIPKIAKIVEDALLYHDSERYRLLAWCIMPNHVHTLIKPLWPLEKIVHTWKSYTAHLGATNETPLHPFWQRDYWDRYMRDDKHLLATLDYIHNNPVKAGLCVKATDWQWSSARFRGETGSDGVSPSLDDAFLENDGGTPSPPGA